MVWDVLRLKNGKWILSSGVKELKLDDSSYTFAFKHGKFDDNTKKWTELLRDICPFVYVPDLLNHPVFWNGNGHFSYETRLTEDKSALQACDARFRCLVKKVWYEEVEKDKKGNTITKLDYCWNEMTFFTHWDVHSSLMICVNTPTEFIEKLMIALKKEGQIFLDSEDPFAIFIPVMDEILKIYNDSVWSVRDVLRPIEKDRKENSRMRKSNFESDFSMFQEIMRHSIHVGEVLAVTAKTTIDMRQCRKLLLCLSRKKTFQLPLLNEETQIWDRAEQRMVLQGQILGNLKLRQQSNHERLQTEVSLAFNTLTQRDSRVLQADSKAMKTVASLTMVYLPATFTSSVFSMSFFNFSPADGAEPERWTYSKHWWIFWVTALALTIATAIFWFILQHIEPVDSILQWWEKRRSKLGAPEGEIRGVELSALPT